MSGKIAKTAAAEQMINQNVKLLSDIESFAVTKIAKAFRFGCNWGYALRTEENFRDMYAAVKEDQHLTGMQTTNGFIILGQEDWLINAVNTVIPALDYNFVVNANMRRTKERELFQNYMKRAMQVKGKGVQVTPQGIAIQLGLYSTNDTNLITSQGKEYPAFKLSIVEAVYTAMEVLATEGKQLIAFVKSPETNTVVPVPVREYYMQNAEKALKDIVKTSTIFDTETGVHFEFYIA